MSERDWIMILIGLNVGVLVGAIFSAIACILGLMKGFNND